MKIIGNIGTSGYIVEIDSSELEKLTGYYYGNSRFKIGDSVNIDALYRQLGALVRQDKEIKVMAHALKTAAGILEKIDPVFYPTKKKG